MKKKKQMILLFLLAVISSTFIGCAIEETDRVKVSDLEFSVVEEEELPEELKSKIAEKKAADFKLSYETEDALYIVRGYGEQETAGYSISVEELYLTRNAIFFKTKLIGPRKGETIVQSPSFPYLVVKTELRDENVVFD